MKCFSFRLVSIVIVCLFALPGPSQGESNDLTLWYQQPAEEWVEALPVGNGSLGAMIFGKPAHERIQFNEDTLWTGVPQDYINPNALEALPRVRQLLFAGKQAEAEKVAWDMMSVPLRQEKYQPFGDILLDFPGQESYTNYKQELNLHTGTAKTTYSVDGVEFTREVFSSYPDQVLAIRITASQPNQIHGTVSFACPHEDYTIENETVRLRLKGQLHRYYNRRTDTHKDSVLRFESQLKIINEGGSVSRDGKKVAIHDADTVTLVLAAATSYANFRDIGNDPHQITKSRLENVAGKDWDALRKTHLEDYQELFDRVTLDLGQTEAANQPTDARIKNFAEQDDPQLVELYFQFGRYLLIASSRAGSQPANLQGIWNEQINPPWESKWTVNINTEMNYWPAEMCNLSECHEPLFAMLEDLTVTGGKVAKEHYNCRGWVLHHNTDIWRGAAPINATNHGIWMTGGAWLCQHLWLHYAYTMDEDYLRARAYPIMKGAALFFVDFLVEDPQTGWLISTPSNSPEIGGLVAGPTMDHQIIRNLFMHCIRASEILGVDAKLRKTLKEKMKRIAPNQIGQHGQLQEWLEDKDDPNNKHRHVSHLWGLHPGNEITPLKTPKLAEACKVTLQHRGDGGTGWSKAWKVNFWARLLDGNHSYKMFSELITKSTLPNMFDTHPPFQIDGNFGGTSGITEMLLQSHAGEIHLLPALPDALAEGRVEGLKARGNVEIAMKWKDGKLVKAILKPKTQGQTITLRYQDKTKTFAATEPAYSVDGEFNLLAVK